MIQVNFEEITGKTVKALDYVWLDTIAIVFTDNTFCIIEASIHDNLPSLNDVDMNTHTFYTEVLAKLRITYADASING